MVQLEYMFIPRPGNGGKGEASDVRITHVPPASRGISIADMYAVRGISSMSVHRVSTLQYLAPIRAANCQLIIL